MYGNAHKCVGILVEFLGFEYPSPGKWKSKHNTEMRVHGKTFAPPLPIAVVLGSQVRHGAMLRLQGADVARGTSNPWATPSIGWQRLNWDVGDVIGTQVRYPRPHAPLALPDRRWPWQVSYGDPEFPEPMTAIISESGCHH